MFWVIQPGLQHNYISIWQHTNAFRRDIVYAFTNTVLTPRCKSEVNVTAVTKRHLYTKDVRKQRVNRWTYKQYPYN